jgi:hypothetical protein
MANNGERQQVFDIQQHLERRRREKPELYQGALQDLSLRQKKDIANEEAFQQVHDIAKLPAGLTCGKCKGQCDRLHTQFKNGQPIQLCPCCESRKNQNPNRERKFQRDVLVGRKMEQYKRELVSDKQVIIFGCLRQSGANPIPPSSYTSLQHFIEQSR